MKHTHLIVTAPFLCLLACAPIRVYTGSAEHVPAIVEAGDVLGTRVKVVDAPGPAVTVLEIRGTEIDPETGENICGRALEKALDADDVRDALTGGVVDCAPKAWSCATVTYIAHELGHIYGLRHAPQTDDKAVTGNLMQPEPGRSRATSKRQRLIVKLHAAGLAEICRRTPEGS